MKKKIQGFKTRAKKKLDSVTRKELLVAAAVVVLTIQFFQVQSLFGTFDFLENRGSSLVSEIGEVKENYLKIGGDLNEVRNYLRLPTSNYNEAEEQEESEDRNEDNVQLAFFEYVNFLGANTQSQELGVRHREFINALRNSLTFSEFLAKQDLVLSELFDDEDVLTMAVKTIDELKIANITMQKDSGRLYVETAVNESRISAESVEEFEKFVVKLVEDNKEKIIRSAQKYENKKSEMNLVLGSNKVAAVKNKLGIRIDDEGLVYNKSDELIGQIELIREAAEFRLIDLLDDSAVVQASDLDSAIVPFLEKLNTKTYTERRVDDGFKSLEDTVNDRGFKLLLKEYELHLGEEKREDAKRIYYDIFNKNDVHLSSVVLEKSTGVINIVAADGSKAENLLLFNPEVKKKTIDLPDVIPNYGEVNAENTFNILIAGKNGSMLDTMIFAHINEDRRDVRMISIPRDLFYNGRKINAFAAAYGMPELAKVLSEITGYKIDKYIVVEMFAFIDVIDIIGGVDVTLEDALIDPSYRTVDHGVEGTLHYEPGDYHLGGKEALRLARSRYTTSDFSRAQRQQLILEAMQAKARDFGFGDAGVIYDLAKAVLAKTETNISFDEAIAYFFRYQNFKIESNNVMSSGNVLYVPPYITKKNCEDLIAAAADAGQEKPGCENENQAYTLLPKDDNWDLIKWFFRKDFS